MRRITILFLLISALSIPAFAEYPPEGWTDSITDAITEAAKDDKILLLNFTGSDWCSWCEKLGNEVFFTDDFESWAEENAVRVFLDFPRNIELPEETMLQNQLLQQYFGVRGYPTVMIFDSNLNPRLQTGYRAGGSGEYIRHIEEDRNLQVESPELFREDFISVLEEYIGPVG